MTNKFTQVLKDTVEIQLLKFIPSQYMLVIGNHQRIKVMYQYSFRDQSKEDDYTDLTQNLMFLEYLNHQIKKLNKAGTKRQFSRNDDNGKKSTHSATKSKMNHPIASDGDEEVKVDDADLLAENDD